MFPVLPLCLSCWWFFQLVVLILSCLEYEVLLKDAMIEAPNAPLTKTVTIIGGVIISHSVQRSLKQHERTHKTFEWIKVIIRLFQQVESQSTHSDCKLGWITLPIIQTQAHTHTHTEDFIMLVHLHTQMRGYHCCKFAHSLLHLAQLR